MVLSTVAEGPPQESRSASVHLKRPRIHSAEADMAHGTLGHGLQLGPEVAMVRSQFRLVGEVEDVQAPVVHLYATTAAEGAGSVDRQAMPRARPMQVAAARMVVSALQGESTVVAVL